jgi:SAM-dependent methyltransferase
MNLQALAHLDAAFGTLLEVEAPDGGRVPFRDLHDVGTPVVGARGDVTGPWPWDRSRLVLRVCGVGARAYVRRFTRDTHAVRDASSVLSAAVAHLEQDGDSVDAWLDAACSAQALGATRDALTFAEQALARDVDAAEARALLEGVRGPLPAPATRARLEAWLRRRGGLVVGPVLDVGTSRAQRPWIDRQAVRLTLDSSESVFDGAAEAPDLRADIEDLTGVPGGTFETVICTEVLEHVRRPEVAVRELLRVTADGGRLVVSVPWIYPFHPTPLDLRRFTLQGLVLLLRDAGWTVEHEGGLPMPAAAHRAILEAVASFRGGPCPQPESMGFTNWVAVARKIPGGRG